MKNYGLNQKQMDACHKLVFEGCTQRDAYAEVYGKKSETNSSLMFSKPHIKKYISQLRDQLAKKNSITLERNLLKLDEIVKESMEGTDVFNKNGDLTGKKRDLRCATEALREQNKLLNFYDKKPEIQLPENLSNPVEVITALLQSFAKRDIDEDDLQAVLRSLEVLQVFEHGQKLLEQLSELNLSTNNNLNIFNMKPGTINEVQKLSE